MSNMEVRCSDCGCVVTHNCFEGAADRLKKLYEFKLEGSARELVKSCEGYEEGDEDAPFFSEGFLYPLLGKDDARTVLSQLSHFIRALGIDPDLTHMKSGCRHRLIKTIVRADGGRPGMVWCESCGAVIQDGWKEWETPTNSQTVPKMKKGKR